MKFFKYRIDSFWWIVIIAAVVKLVIHMAVAGNYELHRDALLYLAQSDHLDWGYWSVPPFTAFLTRIFRTLFGDSLYAIRLLPALTGVVSIFIIGDGVRLLGGRKPALILALMSFLFSVAYLRSNSLLQPVSNDELFWLLAFYVLLRLFKTQDTRYWLLLAAVFGLGFLNKYLIAFLALSLVIAILLSGSRKLLWSPHVIYALLIGLILIAPNIIWQYRHNWVVLYHMELLRKYQLVKVSASGFLAGILLMNVSSLGVWIAGLAALVFGKDFKNYRVIGLTVLIVILLIAILQGKPYYTLGVFTVLFVFGGCAIEKSFMRNRKWAFYPNLILIPLILLPALPLGLPVLKFDRLNSYCDGMKKIGLVEPLKWEDRVVHDVPQDFADMTGWKELAGIVIRTYKSLDPEQQGKTAIYAENYGKAGAIHFYGMKEGLPEPICFEESFLFWSPDTLRNIDFLIYVNDDTSAVVKLFRKVIKTGEVNDPYFREGHQPVWLCSEPIDKFGQFYIDVVRPIKKRFIRNYP